MKFLSFFEPIGLWLIKIGMVAYICINHYQTVIDFNIHVIQFYFSMAAILGCIFLILGSFISKAALISVGGLLIGLSYLYFCYYAFKADIGASSFVTLLIAGCGLLHAGKQ